MDQELHMHYSSWGVYGGIKINSYFSDEKHRGRGGKKRVGGEGANERSARRKRRH
jgi:hypothetical protein